MIDLLGPLDRWLLFAGVVLLGGTPAWRSFIGPRLRGAFGPEAVAPVAALERRVAGAGLSLSLALLPVWGLRLQVQLMGFRDPFAPLQEDLSFLVLETFWGAIWIVQGAILAALAGVFALLRRGLEASGASAPSGAQRARRLPPLWFTVWSLVVLLALTLSLSSHAMSATNRAVAVAADALHTLSAGIWIGTLALILALRPPGDLGRSFLSVQLRSFSPLGMAAVGVLVSMGAGLAVTHLAQVRDLWTSPYGRILSVKIAGAGVVLVLGFLNRRGLEALDSDEGGRTVYRRAAFEVATVAVVLWMTAVLTGRSPSG